MGGGRMCRWARWDEDANANAGCEEVEGGEDGNESSSQEGPTHAVERSEERRGQG